MYVATEYHSDEAAVKRRKVRKGTHSCLECRRRKVKCIYATPDDATCIVCERRGAQCVSQCDSPRRDDVVDQIDHNKANAGVINQTLVDGFETNTTNPQPTNTSTALLGISPVSESKLLDVRWNAKEDSSGRIVEDCTAAEPQTCAAIREALLCALPCETDISILSERVSIVSALCYQSDYKSHSSGLDQTPKQHIPVRSLLYPERHPIMLARQMLLFAAAVQHLSPKEEVPGLTEHQHIIMNRLAESAMKLVNTDDALVGSLDGIENLIFEIFFHIDCGNIRRAWITTRRAVTVAQMLGLQRPGHYRFVLISDESDLDPMIMWSTIVSMERLLSLLLGLPTSTGHAALACQTITSDSALGHNLSAMVGTLAGRILERNQVESAQKALDMTSEIDREVIIAAEQMPSVFWHQLDFAGLEKDSWEALTETRRAFGHMCYYSLVIQLHLPYLLSPHDASQRMYSKITCVNAGREILTRQTELRVFNAISACCRMSDFLALIAGMALMLGHITSHHESGADRLLAHQRLGDRAVVKRVLDCVDSMSDFSSDVLARRCAALLRDLLLIEQDATEQHSPRTRQSDKMGNSQRSQSDILIMRVTYLGDIEVSADGVAAPSVTRTQQAQNLPGSVTIGGIGSMQIRSSHASSSSKDRIDLNTMMPLTSPTAPPRDPNPQGPAVHDVLISARSSTQWDPVFPDAAANLDDWVFQGVDTAFMESLMRGGAAPFSGDTSDEQWDVNTFP